MKKFGDFLLALGIVGFLLVIAAIALDTTIFSKGIYDVIYICGILMLILFGIIIRNIGKNKNAKNMAYNNPNNPQYYNNNPNNPQYYNNPNNPQ